MAPSAMLLRETPPVEGSPSGAAAVRALSCRRSSVEQVDNLVSRGWCARHGASVDRAVRRARCCQDTTLVRARPMSSRRSRIIRRLRRGPLSSTATGPCHTSQPLTSALPAAGATFGHRVLTSLRRSGHDVGAGFAQRVGQLAQRLGVLLVAVRGLCRSVRPRPTPSFRDATWRGSRVAQGELAHLILGLRRGSRTYRDCQVAVISPATSWRSRRNMATRGVSRVSARVAA